MSLNAEYFLSDGIIVTGESTGKEANLNDVKNIKSSLKNIPVFVGSGIEPNNLKDYSDSDAFIVGSYLKKNGYWANEIDIKEYGSIVLSASRSTRNGIASSCFKTPRCSIAIHLMISFSLTLIL